MSNGQFLFLAFIGLLSLVQTARHAYLMGQAADKPSVDEEHGVYFAVELVIMVLLFCMFAMERSAS